MIIFHYREVNEINRLNEKQLLEINGEVML